MNKKIVPQDFTLSLALFDALPVIFFGISMIIIGTKFNSSLFIVGSILATFAGLSKVIWKIIVVKLKKNIWFFFVQMRITMPIGLLMIILSLIIQRNNIDIQNIFNIIISLPQLIFFIFGIIGMLMMLVFGFTLDGTKKKNNWIEQITNCLAQFFFLIGIILSI